MSIIKSRRSFIKSALKNSLIGAAGLATLSTFSSCSSFDDYLFDDRYSFDDEVLIIGGGVSGLYLAHMLRNSKTEFRLFEGSNNLGGRIKSFAGTDYGASLLSNNDILAKKLVKSLSLETTELNKDFMYLSNGMQTMTDVLFERTVGLIPYRSFRLRWKLIEIQKKGTRYNLVFQHPTGQQQYNCKKIALAIPPTQWKSVKGLLGLPEMHWAAEWLNALNIENTVKLILPASSGSSLKPYMKTDYSGLEIRQIIKKNKSLPTLEIDVKYPSGANVSTEKIYDVLKKHMQINYPFQKLQADQLYDWSHVSLIKGSNFRNSMTIPRALNPNFQILGDFTATKDIYSIEGALQSAKQASELLL
ncbi:MAG: FAD/NAD(P)-binding protein [Bdellovibrionota bacterium]